MLPHLDAGLPAPARGLFTLRAGGASPAPYDSLNLAGHVGDAPAAVAAARGLLAAEVGAPVRWPEQVHGAVVGMLDGSGVDPAAGADAFVTALPGVAVGVLAADCLPVLLADPVAGVVGAAHAGRQGLATGVLQATVAAMASLGADPARTVAVIGPAVCGDCYEVPAALREEVAAVVPGSGSTTSWGTPSLDLPAGAEGLLRAAGLARVHHRGACTLTDERFYSYRRDGRTGRHAGVVLLRPPG